MSKTEKEWEETEKKWRKNLSRSHKTERCIFKIYK